MLMLQWELTEMYICVWNACQLNKESEASWHMSDITQCVFVLNISFNFLRLTVSDFYIYFI